MTGDAAGGGIPLRHLPRVAPWALSALVLLLPLVAMQFSDEVAWDGTDFLVMGALLFGACGAYSLAARMTESVGYRAAVGVALASAVILIWLNLAVGIIGSEDNPANLMYGIVLGVGILGALIGRFRPRGMGRALAATAIAQASVGVIALLTGSGAGGESWPWDVVCLTGLFAGFWLVSAWLFRRAARQQRSAGAAPQVVQG